MENTQGIKHVFIIFCDKPSYEEAITKLFEVNKDHRNNLVLLVGLPRRQREVSEKIRAEYPNMKFDSSTKLANLSSQNTGLHPEFLSPNLAYIFLKDSR